MFDVKKQLAVQSYCFRNFKTIDGLIEQIKGIGLSRTELCEVHLDFNNEALFEPALAKLKAVGVQVDSIGVQHFAGDEAKEEKWFKFCKMAGAKHMSVSFAVDSVPGAYRVAEKLADKYDMVLGIHNHGGYDWLGNSTILRNVLANTSPRIGLCIDTAWCIQSREDPMKWADRFNDRIYGVHLKDFVFDRAGWNQDVVVGTGNLKLKEFLAKVLPAKNLKAVMLEYEGDRENPGPKLQECVSQIAAAAN